MKVLLRSDVEHLGHCGDLVKVAAGYARNYLLPKGLAYEATPGNLKNLQAQQRSWDKRLENEMGAAQKVVDSIEAQTVVVKKKAGQSGTLYGAVTTSEIAEQFMLAGIEIDRRKIQLKAPVKALGSFEIPIRIHSRVTATIKLEVQSDGQLEIESASAEAEAAEKHDAAVEAAEGSSEVDDGASRES